MPVLNKIFIIASNLMDLGGLFVPTKKSKKKGIRVLIFNWRDTKHAWAGGAEVYIHELAKRWVKAGNHVTLFCGNDGQSLRNEKVDGVEVVRRGGFYTVYLWAFLYTVFKFRTKFDVVIDSENGIPFFTPLFTRKPVILLIHHVHQEVFIEQMKFPLSYIGRFIEGKLMPFIYRNHRIITVSESSKKEIVRNGIAEEARVSIVNPGIEIPNFSFAKTLFPSIIYLGRLKAYKNVDVAIKAFYLIQKRLRSARMFIVGEGDSMADLHDLVVKLELTKKVRFFGKVSEKEKIKLLSQSWVAVQPSTVEGWGITVLEANACKTPVVASDTKGLRDSIVNNRTGILVRVKSVKDFAKGLRVFLQRKDYRKKASRQAYSWSKKFDWDNSAKTFQNILVLSLSNKNQAFISRGTAILVNRLSSLF